MAFEPLCGWVHDPRAVEQSLAQMPRPIFGQAAASIRGSGKGKVVLLHKILEKVAGRFPIRHQTIGDCVSQGWSLAVDVLAAVEIVLKGESEEWKETASEPIYAASRVEVGGGRISGDGSIGAWAAETVVKYGTLARQKYGDVDLTTYDGARAKKWGQPRQGLPDALEPEAREHRVQTTSLVRSYDEALDAIANGYPVPVCSMQGFEMRRDEEGFMRPKGEWAHCMAFVAADDSHRRPGLLCVNSWGPHWISGPKRHDQPDGSGWVDAEVCDRMLGRDPDSFAVSGFCGYPARDLPNHFFG